MDSSHYLTLLLVGQPLLRRTLSLQLHEALRQRIAVHYHLEGLTREELDAYLAHQLKAAGISQPLFDDTATQALYQATKGTLRKVNKLAVTALRLAALRKTSLVMKPSCSTPRLRLCYERAECQKIARLDGAVAGATSGAAASHNPVSGRARAVARARHPVRRG